MTLVTRKRLVGAAFVGAFSVAFAAHGAVSRSQPAVAATPLPSLPWYWTMAVSPSDPDTLVLGTNDGLYRSEDGGKTWTPTGLNGVNATSVVGVGGSMFAGGVSVGPNSAPVISKGSGRTAPDGADVLAESTDGGKTWRVLHPRGLPKMTIQSLAVDPKSKALYVLLNDGGLYRSTDGARSFRALTPKVGIAPWAIASTGSRLVGGDMDSGAHVSANGKAWRQTPFTDPRGSRMVMEYAVQPADPTHVLMSSYGVVMSSDGGDTWHVVLRSPVMFGPVAWAPSTSDVAYAVGFDRSVWRSADGAKSWTKVT